VPGREWGPGWVSWRRGNDYCGWAPLPPESRTRFSFTATVDRDYDLGPAAYIFISLSNFGVRSYAPICAPLERNVTIIQNTVNITNINYNRANNQTVVYNGGPSYNLVRTRSKDPVEQVNVNFAQVNKTVNNTTINKTKVVNIRQGNTLQVAAPPTVAATASAVPSKVKAKIEKPKVEKGWEGVDASQVQKVKQQLAASSVERKHKPTTAVLPTVPAAAPTRPERPAPSPAEPVKVAPETPKTAGARDHASTPRGCAESRAGKLPHRNLRKRIDQKPARPNPDKPGSEAPPAPLPRPDKHERPKLVPPASPECEPDTSHASRSAAAETRSPFDPFSPATPAVNRPKASAAPETERELPKVPKVNRAPADSAPILRSTARSESRSSEMLGKTPRVIGRRPFIRLRHNSRGKPPQPPANDTENKKKKKDKEGGQ
jgi:hypothetical protein